MSVSRGELARIPTPSAMMAATGLSADSSELLLVDERGDPPSGPLWSMPVLGGSPRRLGETEGNSASWSPDGKRLVYGNMGDLFLANADGSEPHKLDPPMKVPSTVGESRLVAGRLPFAIRNLGHCSRCERALGNLGGWNGLASLAARLETDRAAVLWEVDGRWKVLCLHVTRPSLGIAAKGKSLRL